MKRKFYHPELDRLRFVAFFAVFLHHYFPHYASAYRKFGSILANLALAGGLGVDLFFCLSSFLITTLLIREADYRGTIDLRAFWIRRILRIWPLYYFFIAFTALIVPLLLNRDHFGGSYLFAFVFFIGNWKCAVDNYPSSVVALLWSVSIEEQFYLAWPLLLKIVSVKCLPHLAFVCLLMASTTRLCAVFLKLPHPFIWCNTFARLDPIALGALFAVFNHHRKYTIRPATRLLLLILSVLLPLRLLLHFGESCFSGSPSLLFYPIVAICCVFTLMAFFNSSETSVQTDGGSGLKHWCLLIFVYLGRISYGLYVFHYFAIDLSDTIALPEAGPFLVKVLYPVIQFCIPFGLTVGLASASYFLLEKPFLRLKSRFTYVESAPINQEKG